MEDTKTPEQIRPTKKQRELLEYLQKFIAENGYGPSYREIMAGCNYTSVATVAGHVKNLIARGHLQKNGRSARSLEVVGAPKPSGTQLQTNVISPAEEKWLVDKIDFLFSQAEASPSITPIQLEDLQILIQALKVLGLEGASLSFAARLSELKKRLLEV